MDNADMNFRRAATVVVAGLALAACGGDFESIDRPSSGEEGKVRLVNATASNIFLDLFESGNALQTSVQIYGASSYSSLSTGTHALTVRNNKMTDTLATASVTAARDDHQAVVAYTSGSNTGAVVLSETEAAPTTGNAKLRIFNTAAADPVDVYVVTTTCAANAAASAGPLVRAVAGDVTSYITLQSSTTPFHVCITTANARGTLRADVSSFTFSDQRIVTLILVRNPSNTLKVLALDQQVAAPTLASSLP